MNTQLITREVQEGMLLRDPRALCAGDMITCLILRGGTPLVVETPPDETGYFYARRRQDEVKWWFHVDQYAQGIWR